MHFLCPHTRYNDVFPINRSPSAAHLGPWGVRGRRQGGRHAVIQGTWQRQGPAHCTLRIAHIQRVAMFDLRVASYACEQPCFT